MAVANPFAFRPWQVTFWTTLVYLALLIPIICIHEAVPSAPGESALPAGISLSEAWADLANLTQHFHPANSHANDRVRAFLLRRLQQVLDANGASWTTQADRVDSAGFGPPVGSGVTNIDAATTTTAVVFDDLLANVTFPNGYADGRRSAVYYEGTNVYVYIRGRDDAAGAWWREEVEEEDDDDDDDEKNASSSMAKRLVLVNAHYDSVSSGFGATDDGVGVVTGLQLVRYFTTPGHQPQRGVVVLFNNAEEDYLLGATAFANSPLAPAIGTFVNLEGAGAGGRAVLFRSTDLEVMTAYGTAPHPFGSVIANDGFKMGLIRSDTDYRVWVQALGSRGLDVAFMRPRAQYHTPDDDRRHTSTDSVWHMLSAALASARSLASGAAGPRVDRANTAAVWFDLFGDSLVLFPLRGLFAWTLTVLIVAPLLFALLFFLLYKADKDYLFRASVVLPDREPGASRLIVVGGWRGFFRFPLALVVSGSVVLGAAFLLRKVQPFIIHSSLYAVMALMVTLFYFVFWCLMRGANFVRPSAFHRTYSLFWLFVLSWALLVAVAVSEDQGHIASGYIVVFWASGIVVAFLVSLLELFALKTKAKFIEEAEEDELVFDGGATHHGYRDVPGSDNEALIAPSPGEGAAARASDAQNGHSNGNGREGNNNAAADAEDADADADADAEAPTETSPLIGGNIRGARPTTFATGYRRSLSALFEQRRRLAEADNASRGGGSKVHPFGYEQAWSRSLPTWTWFVQFLVLGPLTVIIAGQQLLFLASAVQQTGTDGSNTLMPYMLVAVFTVVLLSPLMPFLHRVPRHLPLLFFAVSVATLVYCLAAFPFSANSPYKFFIKQTFSVDDGNTTVTLTGHAPYLHKILAELPSAAGRPLSCTMSLSGRQAGLEDCSFDGTGLEPRLERPGKPFAGHYHGLVSVNATRRKEGDGGIVSLAIDGVNTKSCAVHFDQPVADITVRGGLGWDTRFDFDTSPTPGDDGGDWAVGDVVLWRRDWSTPWVVDVAVRPGQPTTVGGEVVCRWADANAPGTVPAVDEAFQYAPPWAIVSIRSNPPLVQGSKRFSV
ncbi:peptidase family m28 family [Niveomyces insectorum RCEF 264]|uniref:Peptide hydrolase n=1 Tax=Niveomyces insectorum RCEF 264 TaxID=1081102 RepID=A0A167X3E1_9HYPO|nr:peptidase family m28 family [Niveomyces insectorum RCEF 264]